MKDDEVGVQGDLKTTTHRTTSGSGRTFTGLSGSSQNGSSERVLVDAVAMDQEPVQAETCATNPRNRCSSQPSTQ